MPIKLHISPRLVKSVSSLYNDPNRIFMEYIDNSLDSAEHWFSDEAGGYTRPIHITLKLEGANKKEGKVTIADNCFGITNFKKVVQSIGDSDKKAQGFTNGQFGYGIYSFMAACEKLEVLSKVDNEDALYIPIFRCQFDEARQEDVQFPDPKITKDFPFHSGSVIILSEFDQISWRQINIEELKSEVEKHFELLLRRKNLSIKIIDSDRSIYPCLAFDYETFEGEIYEDYVTDFITKDGRSKGSKITIKAVTPVHVFLKMTKGLTINRPPVFISKGRRICEIKDVKSFNSKHKSDIWSHPNVTGFIDLKDLLGPTIARNDFRNNNQSKALYNTLYELEEFILEFVKKANIKSEERHYQQLEDVLNKALSKLARIDSMNYRTDYVKGGDINLKQDGLGVEYEEGMGGKDFSTDDMNGGGEGDVGAEKDEGIGPGAKKGDIPNNEVGGDKIRNEEQFDDSSSQAKERKKSGFNIRISDTEPQIDSESGKAKRSLLIGSEIIIYKKHPDFQERAKFTRQGEAKISERLITYLAGEITVHYKDKYYNKLQEGQPEYNINMFIGLMEFVYQFEDMLTPLAGKNLSDL